MPARILLVEDDDLIRTTLRLVLEDEGNTVIEAPDGELALRSYGERSVDVVVLDLTLPGMDGFEVCRALRKRGDVPIVMLTARTDTHDQVAGLEAGADDYVTKPVEPKVLTARIRALLRRAARSGGPHAMRFGELEIEPEAGVVRLRGTPLELTKTELLLLCELARSAGKVLTREVLLERVWGYDYLGDTRLVDVAIRRLRGKIEDDPARPDRVVTVRGLGYRFEP